MNVRRKHGDPLGRDSFEQRYQQLERELSKLLEVGEPGRHGCTQERSWGNKVALRVLPLVCWPPTLTLLERCSALTVIAPRLKPCTQTHTHTHTHYPQAANDVAVETDANTVAALNAAIRRGKVTLLTEKVPELKQSARRGRGVSNCLIAERQEQVGRIERQGQQGCLGMWLCVCAHRPARCGVEARLGAHVQHQFVQYCGSICCGVGAAMQGPLEAEYHCAQEHPRKARQRLYCPPCMHAAPVLPCR